MSPEKREEMARLYGPISVKAKVRIERGDLLKERVAALKTKRPLARKEAA